MTCIVRSAKGSIVRHVDMDDLLAAHQAELLSKLTVPRTVLGHPTAKGTAAERDWIGLLSVFLPSRYQVSKAFVVDSGGVLSDEIDIVVHDRHYSPLLFHHQGATYVPAEAVYAVFEVKSRARREDFAYAAEKVASVRRLRRTSLPVPHAGGTFGPRTPLRILAGLVAMDASWRGPIEKVLEGEMDGRSETERLDLGCLVRRAGFEISYRGPRVTKVRLSSPRLSASFFMLRLLARLQRLATVPAMDFDSYLDAGIEGVVRKSHERDP